MTIKVLIIDDAVVIRKILTDVINKDPDLEVIGAAANGRAGLAMIDELQPDVVTLDIEMPEMDGLETLRAIRATNNTTPVIMFSTLTTKGGEATLDALAAGASDYVAKPANVGSAREAFSQVSNELVPRLKLFGSEGHGAGRTKTYSKPAKLRPDSGSRVRAVLVGSSTGGPTALETMLKGITTPLPVPMLIVQHMPPLFTATLAERLDRFTASSVSEASEGDVPQPGHVYIAPGGRHMVVRPSGVEAVISLHDGPLVNSCRPAADVLFESAAHVYGGEALVVLLTGMGYDGRKASKILHDAGADVYAQDEETSVVWGMPGGVVQDGLACEVLPIERVGPAISRRVSTDSSSLLKTGDR